MSVQWRSLGRSLRANAMRVRRGSPLYNNKKIQGRGVRPRFSSPYTLKTKIFLGKKSSSAPAFNRETLARGGLPRLSRSRLQNPPAKFGAGKFCRFKEQKTDISRQKFVLK
ncbi:MAG: hypothetical protein PHO03_01670 [Candidatus Omnitrophica bacterium]|nr:hypothetical protein [Candidatus Omnitrophota bacterium]